MPADPSRPVFPGAPRIVAIDAHALLPLDEGWELADAAPGTIADPDALRAAGLAWRAAVVPGTVAAADRASGTLGDLEQAPDYDARDWWYRCRFETAPLAAGEEAWLRFEGLATLAEVWLNGTRVATSRNMFRQVVVDVSAHLARSNELLIRFASLRAELEHRRPRPRWRTNLVEHQQLRWFRTSLLGRIPGWSPPVRAVGPWRPVRLERRRVLDVGEGDVLPRLTAAGPELCIDLTLRELGSARIDVAELEAVGTTHPLAVERMGSGTVRLVGTMPVPGAEAWWPCTHGAQPRYHVTLRIATSGGRVAIDLGKVAFRTVETDTADDGFRLVVNGVPVFCRGACWTSADIVTLRGDDERLGRFLQLARDAHMNMLRVGGTMVHEDERFYDRCDELGILVWQDFPYANMHYPVDDPAFRAEAEAEAREQGARFRRFVSLAVRCGGSEVEQQAAMLGLPSDDWTSALFTEVLPAACADEGVGVAYVRNSPTGGPLPFTVNEGISHYYGVGAYLRPLEDARRAEVRFTTETLGFANVPEPATLERFLRPGQAPPHHPRWKARVPRDTGPGWDFDDVRDHYLQLLFGADPLSLRYADVERYLALSRVATGEVMARTFADWRSRRQCWGGLVWFFQDLWDGAGWGVVDAGGTPKAAWHFLQRSFVPLALLLTDEGLNGLALHVVNDTAAPFDGRLRIRLHRNAGTAVADASGDVHVAARGVIKVPAKRLLGRFMDIAGSYRFGPAGHDLVVAELLDAEGETISRALHWPRGLSARTSSDAGLTGRVVSLSHDHAELELCATRASAAVAIDAGRWRAIDNHVPIAPDGVVRVRIAGAADQRPAAVECLGLEGGRCRVPLRLDA